MSRDARKELIRQIEEKRGTKVITYVTSDRQNLSSHIDGKAVSILHEHILQIPENERKKLDLFIYSRGGHSDIPWTIVSMFRQYCEKGSFSVLIPYRAHSAATVIALGADEIVMTKKAELGPIDITMQSGPYNPRDSGSNRPLPIAVEDVMGYFALLNKVGCEQPDQKRDGFQFLAEHVHPLALGSVNRLLEETKLVAYRLLSTRATPFTGDENQEIIRKISSEVYSHAHAIHRTEALQNIGLKQVKNAENDNISEELWELYKAYADLFKFEVPFKPEEELILNNLMQKDWTDINLSCIESLNRCDVYQQSVRTRVVKQVPPQVTINNR